MEDIIEKLQNSDLCFRCGICCKKYQVQLDEQDARKLADSLGIEWEDFKRNYCDPRWKFSGSYLVQHKNGVCIFLNCDCITGEAICTIQEFKPASCLMWDMGIFKKECGEGLKKWGLTVDADGKVKGTIEDLRNFKLFVASMKETGAADRSYNQVK